MWRFHSLVQACLSSFELGLWGRMGLILALFSGLGLVPQMWAGTEPGHIPHVRQFSPQGTIKGVRQVTARFSELMVPLGDPRSADSPFRTDCPATGTPRWIDSRTWVYDFADDLPGGIFCRF